MFIRFVAGADSESPTKQAGLFTEVYYLRDNNLLEDYQSDYAN